MRRVVTLDYEVNIRHQGKQSFHVNLLKTWPPKVGGCPVWGPDVLDILDEDEAALLE